MPAYELIEDRNAVYTETNAVSMIVENCWNGGVVIGTPKAVKPEAIVGVTGRQTLNGKQIGEGKSENPFETLAWLANLLAERKRDLKAGMVVITGSLIPTFSIEAGDRCVFTVDGLGECVMDVT
jgi:2-keto-4-pentenoate hydratase